MSTPRDVPRDIRLELEALGYTYLRKGKHGHLYRHPCGAHASVPGTPSDRRSYANTLANAKRALREKGIDPSETEEDPDGNERGQLLLGRTPRDVVILRYGLALFEDYDLVQARRTLSRAGTVQDAKRLLRDLAAFARGEEVEVA